MVDVDRMRSDLLTARKARDKVTEVALKRALALFANAEAPPAQEKVNMFGDTGRTEVERLTLSDDDRRRLVYAEIAEAETAARQYDEGGQADAADRLRAENAVLRTYVDEASAPPE